MSVSTKNSKGDCERNLKVQPELEQVEQYLEVVIQESPADHVYSTA